MKRGRPVEPHADSFTTAWACRREVEQDIFYKECPEPIGARRANFVVEGKVLVELKAIAAWEDVHITHVLNYLRAYRMEVALLINFGAKSLKFKRLVLSHPTVN